jgi:hypothetical protein
MCAYALCTPGIVKINPAKSKHLETAVMSILGYSVDLVNLRTESYDSSRIPSFVVRVYDTTIVAVASYTLCERLIVTWIVFSSCEGLGQPAAGQFTERLHGQCPLLQHPRESHRGPHWTCIVALALCLARAILHPNAWLCHRVWQISRLVSCAHQMNLSPPCWRILCGTFINPLAARRVAYVRSLRGRVLRAVRFKATLSFNFVPELAEALQKPEVHVCALASCQWA